MPLNVTTLMQNAGTTTASLPQTGNKTLFTISGECRIILIMGRVTTVIGGVANATKLTYVDTVTSTATDICATADINALAAGAFYICNTSLATAANIATTIGVVINGPTAVNLGIIVSDGIIRVNTAGNDGGTGRMRWSCVYNPVSALAQWLKAYPTLFLRLPFFFDCPV